MYIIPSSDLVISENRQRRHFDPKALEELASSIMSKGLLHPPVARLREDGKYELVAGERRTRAIAGLALIDVGIQCNNEFIPPGFIPVTLLSDLDPLAVREAELEENTVRENLTWQEKAAAIAELDSLRRDQAAASGQSHTARDTASEIVGRLAEGAEITKVTEAVIVHKHLQDPEVAAAKTQKEAIKIIKKKAQAAHREALAQTFDLEKTPHTLHYGNALTYLKNLPTGHFDLILTDPPYGINANNFGSMADTRHSYQDTEEYAISCYEAVATEGFRVTKEAAHCYCFLDPRFFHAVSLSFALAGWDVWPVPLIWSKGNGMLPRPEHGPRRTYEMILFASKGNRKVLKVASDVLNVPLSLDRAHGAQKPVALYRDLISRSLLPGQTVLDPFAGSGTIFPAANAQKVIATGCEISKEYYNLALSRIAETDDISDLLPPGVA